MTTTTDVSPVEFDVEPLLFGPDYHRAATPDAADYWTVYARTEDGPTSAEADVRTLTDALLWISLMMDRPAEVKVNAGGHWLPVTVAPITGDDHADTTARDRLLFDVSAAEHTAGVPCGCADGFCPTVPESGGTDTGHVEAVVSCSACIANGLTGCAS